MIGEFLVIADISATGPSVQCSECGEVNFWSVDECRNCGKDLFEEKEYLVRKNNWGASE